MESLFENKHAINRRFLKELYLYQYFLHPASMAVHLILIALFILYLFWDTGTMIRYILLIYVPLFLITRVIRYLRTVRLMEKRYQEVGGGKEVENTIIVYPDRLHLSSSNGGANQLPLSEIKNSFSTKHFYFLRSRSKLAYSFAKDGFVKGDLQGLIAFLKEKGLKVK
ncbi:MAG: YcxB family protein [Clostridiales bacterium]|nr:YcxB family protein [Clostridiales bacterium]